MGLSDSRLLVAVSSPWASQKFAAPIVDLARRLDAEAIVVHVARPQDEDEDEATAKQRGEQTLKLLINFLREAQIKTEAVMLFSDDVSKAIVNTAKARKCTMIVLGLTKKSTWQRLIAGNMPENIIRHSELPVLICPAEWGGRI